MRKRVTRSLIALLCAFTLHDASACYGPLPQQLISVDEQIARARDVTVAMAVSATPAGTSAVEYRFVVQQRLAGPEQGSFTLMGGTASGNHKDTSFEHHTAPAFWKHGGGRTINESDCIIAPSFVLGESYLVFQGSPATWRSFEKIETVDGKVDENDQWLAYVKARLATRPAWELAADPG